MYYGMIALAVILFGGTFALNQQYERKCGNDLFATVLFTLVSGSAGLIALLAIHRFAVSCTAFTLLVAAAAALNSMLFTFCSLRALHRIDLSLYSLFSMIGGMTLPFLAGLFFYREPMTLAKGICFTFVLAALLLGMKRREKTGGIVYYIAIFVLNGMSGVLAKIFEAAPYPKADAASYSILTVALTVGAAILLLPVALRRNQRLRPSAGALVSAAGHGVFNRIANLLLLVALGFVPISVQYPMVTGGVMIVSTVIGSFSKVKPTRREVAAVIIAFAGIVLLVTVPI